jgi:hypothetical protein
MKSLILFPYTFVLMNWAAVVGLCHFLRGTHDLWSGYEGVDSLPRENQLDELADRPSEFSDVA